MNKGILYFWNILFLLLLFFKSHTTPKLPDSLWTSHGSWALFSGLSHQITSKVSWLFVFKVIFWMFIHSWRIKIAVDLFVDIFIWQNLITKTKHISITDLFLQRTSPKGNISCLCLTSCHSVCKCHITGQKWWELYAVLYRIGCSITDELGLEEIKYSSTPFKNNKFVRPSWSRNKLILVCDWHWVNIYWTYYYRGLDTRCHDTVFS